MAEYPNIISNGQWTAPAQQQVSSSPIGVLPQASLLYQQGGQMPYPFATQAWLTPIQEQGYLTTLQGLQHGVGQSLQNQALAQGMFGGYDQLLQQQGMSASPGYVNSIGGSFNPWLNPALDDYVQRANNETTRAFLEGVMPRLSADAMAAGQSGSSVHQKLKRQSMNDLQRNLGNQAAQMYTSGFNEGMNRYTQDRGNTLNAWLGANRNALTGWGYAPNMYATIAGANMAAPNALAALGGGQSEIGSYYQGMANQYLAQQRDLWNEYQNRPYNNLNWYANIVYGNPAASMGTSTTTLPAGSTAGNLIGGALVGSQLFNNMSGTQFDPSWAGGQNYTGWGTNPGSQQTNMLNQQTFGW